MAVFCATLCLFISARSCNSFSFQLQSEPRYVKLLLPVLRLPFLCARINSGHGKVEHKRVSTEENIRLLDQAASRLSQLVLLLFRVQDRDLKFTQ